MIKKLLFISFCCLLFPSCNTKNKEEVSRTWIGGKIINPRQDYVIISKNRNVIDTIVLDENDSFIFKVPNPESSIYFISHYEFQAMFVEPGDSIMMYVNTIEFDESLSFTGKGSEKNNLLMDLFLLNEKLDQSMPPFYNLSPKEFEVIIDSISNQRYDILNDFKKKNELSNAFNELVTASIDYGLYAKKELYISANSKKELYDNSIVIPENFYSFRKKIDLGSETLRNYYPYYRCIGYYIDNLAFEKYKDSLPFDRLSYTHSLHKLKIIDSLVTNEALKNSLLRNTAGRYLVNGKNEKEQMHILKEFTERDTDSGEIEEVTKLAKASMQLSPGKSLPNVMLLTTDNTVKDLHSVINRPTVIYFWSSQSTAHFRKIHNRANDLRNKFPEYNFIGINVDNHFKKWLRIVNNSGYITPYEFQFENFEEAEMKLMVNSFNKSIIVNQHSEIKENNSNIFGLAIEQKLRNYLNQ